MTDDNAGLNRCLICKGPSGGQLCEPCMEHNRGGGDSRGDLALAWWLTLRTVPYLTLAGSALVLASYITVHAAGYRSVLETFLPGSWIATEAGGGGKPGSTVVAVGAVPGSFPWILTFATVAWFSFRSTRRTIRKSAARKLADWWPGIDGAWYPPLVPAGTYDAAAMRWLATDGLWYPPPADGSGPAGADTGWWLASDGLWFPPQLGATP